MKHTILIVAVVVSCLSSGCPSEHKPQDDPVDAKIAELHKKVFDPPLSYADVKTAKTLVRDIIAIAGSSGDPPRRAGTRLNGLLLERSRLEGGRQRTIELSIGPPGPPLQIAIMPSVSLREASLLSALSQNKFTSAISAACGGGSCQSHPSQRAKAWPVRGRLVEERRVRRQPACHIQLPSRSPS